MDSTTLTGCIIAAAGAAFVILAARWPRRKSERAEILADHHASKETNA